MSSNLPQSPSSADLTAFFKRYQKKRENAKRKILSDVSFMVDDMFDYILEEVLNVENGGTLANALLERTQLFAEEASASFLTTESTANSTIFASTPNIHEKTQQMTPTQRNRKCPPRYSDSSPLDVGSISNLKNSKSNVIKIIISDDGDIVSSFFFSPESSENEAASDELAINLDGTISSLGESSQASSSNSDNTKESTYNNSDPDVMEIDNRPSTSQASTSSANSTSSPSPAEGTISETVLQSHLKLNKAMFCIFYDGDGYFLCDIEAIPSSCKRSGSPFYKLYNVNVARLYKTFTKIGHFLPFIRLPLKREQQNLQRKGRILVAWKEDDYLKPATIHEVYPNHGRVQVDCDSGESGVIPIEDIWQLPEGAVIPFVTSIMPSSAVKPFIRDKSIADDIYNHYVEHKPSYSIRLRNKGKKGTDLEGAWRWEESLGETSLNAHKIGGLVKANTYKSVWKNDRTKFSVGDSVVIWHDYEDNSDTKPSFPRFGLIKHLYENVSTKGKHAQFYWYFHPAEKENCQLKQLNGAIFISNDITTVDIDFLIGKVTVKTYGEFEATHPKWKYIIDDVKPYRDSLVENPIREYFTPGTFDYNKDVFIYDVDLLRRDDPVEFFRKEEPAPPAKTTPKTKKRKTTG